MKMLIVENELGEILNFMTAAQKQKWDCITYAVQVPVNSNEQRRFLQSICEMRPDVVIIDIALCDDETELIDDVSLDHANVNEDMFSGFKYCRTLVKEKWKIPIVFLTQINRANVTRAAANVGADLVLAKDSQVGDLLQEVTDLVRSKASHDPKFFRILSDTLSLGSDMLQERTMELAMNRFFLNQSTVRRFGLFTASLKGILSSLFQGNSDAEKNLMLSLVKSQLLLSLADPRLRDHVKHTGNVFWVGYQLLHEVKEFEKPEQLTGAIAELYNAPGMLTPRDQLFHSWVIASLFHDFGYVDERQGQLTELVHSLVPSIKFEHAKVRSEDKWNSNMDLLRKFVNKLFGHDNFLYHYIDQVMNCFETEKEIKGKKKQLIDHGFLSAHRLLDMIPLDKLDEQMKNVVMHAAMAIVYHNYVEIMENWKLNNNCDGQLEIGALPICSLLTFCDNIQTWDRESELDPALSRSKYDDFLTRLVMNDTSYVSGSEICEYSILKRGDNTGYDFKLKLRYFVETAGSVLEVCEKLKNDIQAWKATNRLNTVCEKAGISLILRGQIEYELPIQYGNIQVDF